MWAGPAQLTGPSTDPEIGGLISAQNGWAELDPTYSSSSFFLFWGRAGRSPANWARLRQVQPKVT
jgi:hypothetical protein